MTQRLIAIAILLLLPSAAYATTVQAQVKDINNALYSNCHGEATFRGENTTPGAGPYRLGGVSTFQTVVPFFCDSQGNFSISVADNNQISPAPSQWNFSICSATGPPPLCFNALITITGLLVNVTSILQPLAPILPGGGGGGGSWNPPNPAPFPGAVNITVGPLNNFGTSNLSPALNISGFSAINLTPDPWCAVFQAGSQDSLCNLNGLLVWNPVGISFPGYALMQVCLTDYQNTQQPSNGQIYAWSTAKGCFAITNQSGGGGGTPGGLDKQLQTNNSGVFGGVTNLSGGGNPLLGQGTGAFPKFQQGIVYVSASMNWSQSGVASVCTAGSPCTLTLTGGPVGVDTTNQGMYQIHFADGASSEDPQVTGGSCTLAGGLSCTVIVTTAFNHPLSGTYTLQSSTAGGQESLNANCGASTTAFANIQCHLVFPSNGPYIGGFTSHTFNDYNFTGTLFVHTNQSFIDGSGVSVNCLGRGPCVQVGNLVAAPLYSGNTVKGFSFRSPTNNSAVPAYAGSVITNTACDGAKCTITTSSAHGFRVGDLVNIQFTDEAGYHGDAIVATVPTSATFTYTNTRTITSATTPGVVALEYSAVLDNGQSTKLVDIQYDLGGESGAFNHFFDLWDDENATIDNFNNNAIPLNGNANWSGSFVYASPGANVGKTLAAVPHLLNSTITAVDSNCGTADASNGFYVENTVCQSTGLWQYRFSNEAGNFFQTALIQAHYPETTLAQNPASPAHTPFPGLGNAGLIIGKTTASGNVVVQGNNPQGGFQNGGAGATNFNYFIVAHDTTTATFTAPMEVMTWLSTGSDTPIVKWPRVANGADTIVYDVIRMQGPAAGGGGAAYPGINNCPGGTVNACGSITTSLSQATACSGGLVCSFSDSGIASNTTAYPGHTPTYQGYLNFWPGAFVVEGQQVKITNDNTSSFLSLVDVGIPGPVLIADFCYGNTGSYTYIQCPASGIVPTGTYLAYPATLMADIGSSGPSLVKGRLNFTIQPGINAIWPHHIITLVDSQPALTQGSQGNRPLASANDVWLGTDVAASTGLSNGQLAMGAPIAISNYIANTGDNSSWLERLTSTLKSFKVAVNSSVSVSTGIAPIVCGSAPGCWGASEASTATTPTAGQDAIRADSTSHQLKMTQNGAAEVNLTPTEPAAGTSVTLVPSTEVYVCTSTCTVTVPMPPINGTTPNYFCVYNDDNVATVITLAALGSSGRYENTARTAYGTAGTGTFVSGGAVKDFVCITGRDATHYLTTSSNGTWTPN